MSDKKQVEKSIQTKNFMLDLDQVSGATPNLAIDDVTLEIDPGDLRYLTFAVWQVSAQVGRGFAREATVEIVP